MIRRNRKTRWAIKSLGLAAILVGVAASPALAAPEFEVQLEDDGEVVSQVVSHSDERVDYTAKVKNIAANTPPVAGEKLFCHAGNWSQAGKPAFTYQWLRNGEPIVGATEDSYVTTTPADEGKVIQCQVAVTNTIADESNPGDFVAAIKDTRGVIVEPQPVTAPPTPPTTIAAPTLAGTLNGTGTAELTCEAGTWEGAPTSYTYRWYRNGKEIEGSAVVTASTETKLTLLAGEQPPPAVFQCTVTGTNAGGSVAVASFNRATQSPIAPHPGASSNSIAPFLTTSNSTSGLVTLELELPGGEETFANETIGAGWSCDKVPPSGTQHAKAICTSSELISPGGFFPPLRVVTALGADAPDLAVAQATVFGSGAATSASAKDEFVFAPFREFGFVPYTFRGELLDCEEHAYTQAGGHPCKGVGNFELTKKRTLVRALGPEGQYAPIEHFKRVFVDIPRGVVGNALAVPELCPGVKAILAATCPHGSFVGAMDVVVRGIEATLPIYAIEPEFGTPAQFAFPDPLGDVYTLSPRLRPDDGYAVTFEVSPPPKVDVLATRATICDFGIKGEFFGKSGNFEEGCREPGEPGATQEPLFTNPTRCGEPRPLTKVRLDSWEHPGVFKEFEFAGAAITGCDQVKFEPQMKLTPNSHQADSPTGLDVDLAMPTKGLESQTEISQANLKRARITFPEGMSVNPSAGNGLGACSADQVKLKTNLPIECPDSSKIGTVEIDTPLIKETLKGAAYVAKQGDIGGALIGFYLVFDSKKDGILVKVPARVDPNPKTGQLVVTVDESPEAPFSEVRMHFPAGPRATLLNPPKCGDYQIKAELSPWSAADPNNPTAAETVTQTSTFSVTSGPNGGPCPTGALSAKLSAGTEKPVAGKTSPFLMRLSREDGTQRFSGLTVNTPPGLTAYLKGIPYCPNSVLAGISPNAGTGQAQVDSPSCPAASQIGTASAGAGAGSDLLFVNTGKAYLAGPYKGAPLSLALVAPAVAGPLDLGNVVVRAALRINPETAQVSAVSDPIPTMLHGILLDIRDIRVALNRPHFTLNPTSCEPKSVGVDVKGENGGSASLSDRFQVGGCSDLTFKPKLGIRLFGGTHRGAHPRLVGTVEAGPGEANIGRAAVTIPRSEFLDQGHIRTICTRVQFAADACPKGSIYGHVSATTPLLDYPVEGPVYLRSSSHKLPDLVMDLQGPAYQPIEAVVVGRIDSIKGQIRNTFENVPDVPLTKVVLKLQGGKKGLLVNSRNICAGVNRATVKLTGQNNRAFNSRPAVKDGKCNQGSKAKRKR